MKPSTDPTRDPASEARDDYADVDYRDPSKEDREPKFRVPPNPPADAKPIPAGWVYYGLGPLKVIDRMGKTQSVRCLIDNQDSPDLVQPPYEWSTQFYSGCIETWHYIIRRDSPLFNLNFIYDEH